MTSSSPITTSSSISWHIGQGRQYQGPDPGGRQSLRGSPFTRVSDAAAEAALRTHPVRASCCGDGLQALPSEPIREVLESDESDVIPCRALDSLLRSARCGHPNTALRRTAVAFVTPVI